MTVHTLVWCDQKGTAPLWSSSTKLMISLESCGNHQPSPHRRTFYQIHDQDSWKRSASWNKGQVREPTRPRGKKTWQLNSTWYPGWEAEAEKGHSRKNGDTWKSLKYSDEKIFKSSVSFLRVPDLPNDFWWTNWPPGGVGGLNPAGEMVQLWLTETITGAVVPGSTYRLTSSGRKPAHTDEQTNPMWVNSCYSGKTTNNVFALLQIFNTSKTISLGNLEETQTRSHQAVTFTKQACKDPAN